MRLRKRQFRERDNHQSSRSRIDQDEFEIRRQFRIIKFKGLESRSRIDNRNSRNRIEQRNSRSRIRRSISRSRIEQRNEKLEFEIRRQIRI